MKAARYYGIKDIRCEGISKPECGKNEVLIRVSYAGICGSDLHIFNKGMFIQNIPETMGHEFAGIVEFAGTEVTSVKAGDIVTANPMVVCGECIACRMGKDASCDSLGFIGEVRPGAYAEYIVMPEKEVVKAPEGSDVKRIALAEPLAVVLNILENAKPSPDDRILVVGAGPIGLLTVIAAKSLYGVKNITVSGRSKGRLETAKAIGADIELAEDDYFDKVIEAAGNERALSSALSHVLPGGSIYVVSIFEDDFIFDINTVVAKQISLVGCNVYEKRHIEDAVKVIADGTVDVSKVISGTFALEDCMKAFELLCEKEKKVVKLLFQM